MTDQAPAETPRTCFYGHGAMVWRKDWLFWECPVCQRRKLRDEP